MRQSKMLRLLEKILAAPNGTKSRAKELEAFAASPFFNTNPLVANLLGWYCRFAPSFDDHKMTDEAAFSHLFPGLPFDEAKLRKLRSKLNNLLETFVHVKAALLDEAQRNRELLRFYDEKNLLNDFRLLAGQVRPGPAAQFIGTDLLDHFLLEDTINLMESGKEYSTSGDVSHQSASDALDRFYFYQKTMYACLMVNRERVLGGKLKYDYGLLPALLQATDNDTPVEHPHQIWLIAHQLLTATGEETVKNAYFLLKKKLTAWQAILPVNDLTGLTTMLLNSSKHVLHTRPERHREQFELFRFLVENNVYHRGAVLTAGMYKNIITLALIIGQTDWGEHFLYTHHHLLPPAEDCFNLCQAMVLFEKNQHQTVLDLLEGPSSTSQSTPYNLIIEKRLRLKVLFETKEILRFGTLHDSFSTWLSRNQHQISAQYVAENRQFLAITQDLFKAKLENSTTRLEKLKSKIALCQDLLEQHWLERKVYGA